METNYAKLRAVNVTDKIEKKNGLSYLSWAWAVDQLMLQDPNAVWVYNDPKVFGGDTMMVSCSVTAFGKTMTAQLPVMDHRNKAISSPDAFAVNTAMQRCLVKAIALHGLGLYIYAGEDLPEVDKPITPAEALAHALLAALEAEYEGSTEEQIEEARAAKLVELRDNADQEVFLAAWEVLKPHASKRRAIKEYVSRLNKKAA